MKPLRVEMRVKNNRLIRLREEMGLTQGEFCRRFDVGNSHYSAYETLRHSPLRKSGGGSAADAVWKDFALRLAKIHGVSPEELWPEVVLQVRKNKSTREVSEAEAMALLANSMPEPVALPDEILSAKDDLGHLQMSLSLLSSRDRRLLEMRYGLNDGDPHTFEQIGQELGLSVERIRQLTARAEKRMRMGYEETVASP